MVMPIIFRLHDAAPSGVFEVSLAEAKFWNEKGFGIFWTLNKFKENIRRQTHIEKIVCWCFEIDEGTKQEQYEKIKKGPVPSLVIESKRGYHVYFMAKDAEAKYYRHFLEDRLVPFYNADPNAKDFCRILRVPGFNHMKNPDEPYLIETAFKHNVSYTQAQMAKFFPDVNKEVKQEYFEAVKEAKEFIVSGDDVWNQIYNLDQMAALERISGSHVVGNEIYSFKKNTNGNFNIIVNNKSTSAWIDRNGRIGSTSKGGPTVYQWLRWYGNSPKQTVEFLKQTFQELTWKK